MNPPSSTVLVITHDDSFRQTILGALRSAGHLALSLSDETLTQNVFDGIKIHTLLLEVQALDDRWVKFLKDLKKNPAGEKLSIVILTSTDRFVVSASDRLDGLLDVLNLCSKRRIEGYYDNIARSA